MATPDYVDLLRISMATNGSDARVTVKLGARVPNPMPAGEQMFIGVDLYRRAGASESDYQLYTTGTSDGWLAYLDTPQGFVTYPGTFGVGGDLLVFTVPWRALGDLRGTEFSSFLDWDRKGAVVATTGADATARKRFER